MMHSLTQKTSRSPLAGLLIGAALLALAAGFLVGYLQLNRPPTKAPSMAMFTDYDAGGMQQAMAPRHVEAYCRQIKELGSRYIGQPGQKAAAEMIRRAYERAGLDVIVQDVNTVAPQTIRREVLDESGQAVDGVEVYPFLPNLFAPVSMTDEGVTGELVRVTDEVLDSRETFDDCIAVIDAASPPTKLGVDWRGYAQLGFKATILAHREGMEHIDWTVGTLDYMTINVPINYPRLAGNKKVFDHLGEIVTLHVQSRYENVANRNILGFLPAGGDIDKPASEALVITCAYDATSWLPDLAMGTGQSLSMATQLALLDGLKNSREPLRRDVIFVATGGRSMGQAGAHRLLSILGSSTGLNEGEAFQRNLVEENLRALETQEAILALFADDRFFVDGDWTERQLAGLSKADRDVLDEQLRYVMNSMLLELKEPLLEAKLEFYRVDEDAGSPEFEFYIEQQRRYDDLLAMLGYRVGKLLDSQGPDSHYDFRQQVHDRFRQLADYHRQRIDRARLAIKINKRFQRYKNLTFYTSHLAGSILGSEETRPEAVSLYMGKSQTTRSDYHPSLGPVISDLLAVAARQVGGGNEFMYESLRPRHMLQMEAATDYTAFDSSLWTVAGYPAFALVNTNRLDAYQLFACPVDIPKMRELGSLRHSLQMVGRTVLSLAYGNGRFESTPMVGSRTYSGRVLLGGLGRSIVPNYPLADAMIGMKSWHAHNSRGKFEQMFFWTDPYGRYEQPFIFSLRQMQPTSQDSTLGYSPVAVAFDRRGRIAYIRDEGATSQKSYRSMGLDWNDISNATIVLFRATPVTVLDMINPQTLKAYSAISLLDRDGLMPVKKFAFFRGDAVQLFAEPDRRLYITLKGGAPENDQVQVTRAFMLGIDKDWTPDPNSSREIQGPGYLAADSELLLDVPVRVAYSMEMLNGERLGIQNRHAMADERTNEFERKAEALLDEAVAPDLSKQQEILLAREAVTYHTLNHPVLRDTIAEAVLSILWYLCLMTPFTFFFEKLLFAFTDVRKQLAAHAVIFLAAFGLLKLLHPAFEMIRSSLMILLGFVIVMISTGITILFSGKFQENLEGLRAKRGEVVAAETNMIGVIGTAFMLGLNNMHRRKVRTGLTCATLALITFAMICFTTTQSDLKDTEFAVGKAPYQGILIKDERLEVISDQEIMATRTKFGDRFGVAERRIVVARINTRAEIMVPDLLLEHEMRGATRSTQAKSVLIFEPDEPLAPGVTFLTRRTWFYPDGDARYEGLPSPIMLSRSMAEKLGVTAQAVDGSQVVVQMNGRDFLVHSIFDADSVRGLRDLDGKDILPFDAQSMQDIQKDRTSRIYAIEPYTRIDPEDIVIARTIDGLYLGESVLQRRCSIAINLVDKAAGEPLAYKKARGIVDAYLEQSGRVAHYGLGGVAYRGQRTRERSVAGMLDMIIPLIIAALTVLNTIRGSVYERRDEIYVYNAVGIAPRYVFFMFFAEAFVYATVGTVLGYFLSQGTGRILTELGWTGGLNMTFTSFNTIMASLAIMVAVFASTLFPALSAMAIAAPAEESGWDAPEPVGDNLSMALPFTYNGRDRLAVLEFFNRFFIDHGEGSSGAFFCDDPVFGVVEGVSPLDENLYVPQLTVTVWLKPYDLGVSQKLTITLPTDPQTREYIAHLSLDRLSGARKAWTRLNRSFLIEVRRHFLHWRAVGSDQREEMFQQAREIIAATLSSEGAVYES